MARPDAPAADRSFGGRGELDIGVLSFLFPPEPALVPGSLAHELAARGHRVRVLTGYPHYPDGRTYAGFRQRWRHQTETPGLVVRRVPRYPSRDLPDRHRSAGFLSFAASVSLAGPGYLSGVDVLYVNDGPATTYAVAALLRRMPRVPTVLHAQEVWPEPAHDARAPGAGELTARLRELTGRIYRAAGAVVVAGPAMRDVVIARGADPAAVLVVPTWTDERLFTPGPPEPADRAAVGHRGRCTVMYAGNMGPAQGVQTAIRAAAAAGGHVDLVMVGGGAEEEGARRLAAELGTTNVRFLGWQPPERMPGLCRAVEYQLVLLRDRPALRATVPAKLSAAMAAGCPVVVSAAGDAAELVEVARAGLSSPPEDWRQLADRFVLAATIPPATRAQMGQRARDFYLSRMSLRAGVDEIERTMRRLAAVPQRGTDMPVTPRPAAKPV